VQLGAQVASETPEQWLPERIFFNSLLVNFSDWNFLRDVLHFAFVGILAWRAFPLVNLDIVGEEGPRSDNGRCIAGQLPFWKKHSKTGLHSAVNRASKHLRFGMDQHGRLVVLAQRACVDRRRLPNVRNRGSVHLRSVIGQHLVYEGFQGTSVLARHLGLQFFEFDGHW